MKAAVSTLGLILVVVVFGSDALVAQTQTRPPAKQKSDNVGSSSKASEPFRAITEKDKLQLEPRANASRVNSYGEIVSASGVALHCKHSKGNDKIIETKTGTVVNGRLETKSYGAILIKATGEPTFRMQESNIKKLRAFLGF